MEKKIKNKKLFVLENFGLQHEEAFCNITSFTYL